MLCRDDFKNVGGKCTRFFKNDGMTYLKARISSTGLDNPDLIKQGRMRLMAFLLPPSTSHNLIETCEVIEKCRKFFMVKSCGIKQVPFSKSVGLILLRSEQIAANEKREIVNRKKGANERRWQET